jgi:hypothetical protein
MPVLLGFVSCSLLRMMVPSAFTVRYKRQSQFTSFKLHACFKPEGVTLDDHARPDAIAPKWNFLYYKRRRQVLVSTAAIYCQSRANRSRRYCVTSVTSGTRQRLSHNDLEGLLLGDVNGNPRIVPIRYDPGLALSSHLFFYRGTV